MITNSIPFQDEIISTCLHHINICWNNFEGLKKEFKLAVLDKLSMSEPMKLCCICEVL